MLLSFGTLGRIAGTIIGDPRSYATLDKVDNDLVLCRHSELSEPWECDVDTIYWEPTNKCVWILRILDAAAEVCCKDLPIKYLAQCSQASISDTSQSREANRTIIQFLELKKCMLDCV